MVEDAGPTDASVTTIVHPTAVIGMGVSLGAGVKIGPLAVLTGPLQVGDGVWIGAGSVIGAPPEVTSARMNLAWDGDLAHAGVVIESDAVVREGVIIHQGTHRPTRVGPGAWLLNRCYLAHDVLVGDGAVVSGGVSIGGHCTIGAGANIGMNAAVHQRRVVGPGAMVGMSTAVTRDVPPFALVHGSPPRLRDVNSYALRRAGHGADVIEALRAAYGADADLAAVHPEGVLEVLADELGWWAGLVDLCPVRVAIYAADA